MVAASLDVNIFLRNVSVFPQGSLVTAGWASPPGGETGPVPPTAHTQSVPCHCVCVCLCVCPLGPAASVLLSITWRILAILEFQHFHPVPTPGTSIHVVFQQSFSNQVPSLFSGI